jgi:hypothetical protein
VEDSVEVSLKQPFFAFFSELIQYLIWRNRETHFELFLATMNLRYIPKFGMKPPIEKSPYNTPLGYCV